MWCSGNQVKKGKKEERMINSAVDQKKGDPELTPGTNNMEIIAFHNKCDLAGVQGRKTRGKWI